MDPHFVQTLRYKLQRRIRRLSGVDWHNFGSTLKQVWPFIHNSELFMGLLEPVLQQRPGAEEKASKVLAREGLTGEDELEAVAIAFHVLQKTVSADNPNDIAVTVGLDFVQGRDTDGSDFVDAFREQFVEPLYEYLDEQLDDQGAICALLVRYKRRCEWFGRDELRGLLADSSRGEKRLATDLYRYLHDQGMDFHIEPSSASGEVDLLASQTGDDRLVLDAKIFDPDRSKGKSYLVSAFNQIYTYARDHNESAGYLAIYQATPREPRFTFARSDSIFPYLEHNGKIIYFIVIDIAEYEASASKRGQAQVIEITQDDLIRPLMDAGSNTVQ